MQAVHPSPAPRSSSSGGGLWAAVRFAWELGYIIALPIIVFGFCGAYLDKRVGTSPLFLLLGIGFSLVVTGIGIYRKLKEFESRQK